jgi:hypothetical protein
MLEVPGSRRNPRVQIFPLEYLEIHARYSGGSLETFTKLIVSADKNRLAALAAGPPGWCGGRTQIIISLYSKFFGEAFLKFLWQPNTIFLLSNLFVNQML